MKYISLFSGIEAASVAWEPLGWEPVAFAEIEPFPCAVLKERFPEVPNLGDVTKVDWSAWYGKADIVIGGSPCQSFSVAGLRKGLADPRGNLMLEYLRACYAISPEWIVWENVPGVLSSNGGRDFQALLEAVAELWPGGGAAWRVLDAQFFGVAQRRRRVFLVVNTRDWRRAAAVLQDAEVLRGNSQASRAKREELARTAGYRPSFHREWNPEAYSPEHAGGMSQFCLQGSMFGRSVKSGPQGSGISNDVCFTLNTVDRHAVCAFTQNTRDEVRFLAGDGSYAGALSASRGAKQQTYVLMTANTGANGSNVSEDEIAYTLDGANGVAVCRNDPEAIAVFKGHVGAKARGIAWDEGGGGGIADTRHGTAAVCHDANARQRI